MGHQSDTILADVLVKPVVPGSKLEGVSICPPKMGDYGSNICNVLDATSTDSYKRTFSDDIVRTVTDYGIITNKGLFFIIIQHHSVCIIDEMHIRLCPIYL